MTWIPLPQFALILAGLSAAAIPMIATSNVSSNAESNRSICFTCEEGCIGSDPIADTGGCIVWDSLPNEASGDCDPLVYPDPPCITERPCTLDGVLKFHLGSPCSGTWRFRIVLGGANGPWIKFSGAVEVEFNRLDDSGQIACGDMFKVEFSYLNSSGSYVMSSAKFEFSCSACEDSEG
ncbi:MAG: hypothetical protein HZB39_20415 [Planctomycetes bacterium]|nr:hypothetical protein [Planctomycetota bacterium]